MSHTKVLHIISIINIPAPTNFDTSLLSRLILQQSAIISFSRCKIWTLLNYYKDIMDIYDFLHYSCD